MNLWWGFFCSCVLLCPEGHHILWAPEALHGHRHGGDCAGRRHSALREESLQEDVLSRYFRANQANCPTVHIVLVSFLKMCVIFRKRGKRPSQHTVSVATTSDFLDFLDFSDFQLVNFCVFLRTPGENDASESNSSVRQRKMWRLESSTRSTFPLVGTFQVQLESIYACQH